MSESINYDDLKKTDFYSFFNIHEDKIEKIDNYTYLYLKTGGFQEYIDLIFVIDDSNNIIKAELTLDRKFIGGLNNVNPFGKDIAKSFIYTITPISEKDSISPLVDFIWKLEGLNDFIIRIQKRTDSQRSPNEIEMSIINVYLNIAPKAEFKLSSSTFTFENISNNDNHYLKIIWELD
ncbi:MAG: hypothetical protein ACTSPY_06555 [Candidatus Helarchaeota archaeon]